MPPNKNHLLSVNANKDTQIKRRYTCALGRIERGYNGTAGTLNFQTSQNELSVTERSDSIAIHQSRFHAGPNESGLAADVRR
jgi:hypothetical protein